LQPKNVKPGKNAADLSGFNNHNAYIDSLRRNNSSIDRYTHGVMAQMQNEFNLDSKDMGNYDPFSEKNLIGQNSNNFDLASFPNHMLTEENIFGVGSKNLSFLTGNEDSGTHKKKNANTANKQQGEKTGPSNIFRNNSTKTVEVKIEPGCESSPYSEDVTLLSKSEMSENPVQEEVSKRVWRKFAKRFHKIYGLDKKRSEKEAIE
jgi:hypothetical protein